jgi:hypothetical protein
VGVCVGSREVDVMMELKAEGQVSPWKQLPHRLPCRACPLTHHHHTQHTPRAPCVATQSRPGKPGLDAFQLVDILTRLTRTDLPTNGDDAADFQQFVASRESLLLVCCHMGGGGSTLVCCACALAVATAVLPLSCSLLPLPSRYTPITL